MSDTPVKAEVVENAPETIDVPWREFTLTVPSTLDKWDGDALEAIEQQHAMTWARLLLGSKVRDRLAEDFQAKFGRKMLVEDWADLMKTIMKQGYGVDTGE